MKTGSETAKRQRAPAAGEWSGIVRLAPDVVLHLRVRLEEAARGDWSGAITVVEDGSEDVPLRHVAVDGTRVRFDALEGFEGTLSADGERLDGTLAVGGDRYPVELSRAASSVACECGVPEPTDAGSSAALRPARELPAQFNADLGTARVTLLLSPS